jgi:hypothetical protein
MTGIRCNSFQQFQTSLKTTGIVRAALANRVAQLTTKLSPPPTISLQIISNSERATTVDLVARSQVGLSKARLSLDGIPAIELDLTGKEQHKLVEISTRPGSRVVSGLAVDDTGTISRPTSVSLHPAGQVASKLRVFSMGINQYNSEIFPPLSYAEADAQAITGAFMGRPTNLYSEYVVHTPLIGAIATAHAIRAGLEQVSQSVKPGDTLVFSFAGHGLTDPRTGRLWLATRETNFSDLETTAIPWDEITSILSRTATRVVVLLDACHSGNADFDRLARNDNLVSSLLYGNRAPIIVFAASKGRQTSLEAQGGGLFTRAFVHALKDTNSDRNGDNIVDASELYLAIKAEVTMLSGGRQTPWLARGDLLGDIPLFEHAPINADTSGLESHARQFVELYFWRWSEGGDAPIDFLRLIFAEKVGFYGKEKSRDEVIVDRKRYAQRWPIRIFNISKHGITSVCNPTSGACKIDGNINWNVRNESTSKSGTASFSFNLERRKDTFVIKSESGGVISRQ